MIHKKELRKATYPFPFHSFTILVITTGNTGVWNRSFSNIAATIPPVLQHNSGANPLKWWSLVFPTLHSWPCDLLWPKECCRWLLKLDHMKLCRFCFHTLRMMPWDHDAMMKVGGDIQMSQISQQSLALSWFFSRLHSWVIPGETVQPIARIMENNKLF